VNTRIEVEVVTGDRITRMEQEFPLEVVEGESFSGDVVVRDERPDLHEVSTRLAADAVLAHRRINH
jgi:hypothetical protein